MDVKENSKCFYGKTENPQSIQCIFIHILYLLYYSFSSLKYSEVKDDGRLFKYSYSADRLHPSVGLTD